MAVARSGARDPNMTAEWDAYADDWDSNPDVIRYAEAAFESLVRITALDGLDILDFGCGTGLLTEKMARSVSLPSTRPAR